MMEFILEYVLGVGIVGGIYAVLPYMTSNTLQFGVRVPPAHVTSPSLAKARRTYYWLWLVIMVIAIVGTMFLSRTTSSPRGNEWVPSVVIFATLLLNFFNYYLARRQLLSAKQRENWYEGLTESLVADTAAHQQKRGPSLAWSAPAVLIGILSFVLPAMHYGQLPQRIAIHFNMAGAANGFADKSFWSVFGPSLVEVVLVVLILIAHLQMHRFAVRLDAANPDASRRRYVVLQREGIKAIWVMFAFINAGLTLMLLPVWGFAFLSMSATTGLGTLIIVVGVVVTVVWLAVAAGKTRRIATTKGTSDSVAARDDDRFWVGGVFYFNRNDAALFIPKRFGIGLTVNMGHPVAWVFVIVIVAIIVLVPILAS